MAGSVTGVLLAAGAGRRAGGPKALRRYADGTPWLVRGVRVLREGGCDAVVVVLGCQAGPARVLLDGFLLEGEGAVRVVENPDWADGMAGSLRAGLQAMLSGAGTAVLVHLVDLPDVTAAVVVRLLDAAPVTPQVLARAVYQGRPGHPVLLGRTHLAPLLVGLSGDRGAADYLRAAGLVEVECGDLTSGRDDDLPPGLAG